MSEHRCNGLCSINCTKGDGMSDAMRALADQCSRAGAYCGEGLYAEVARLRAEQDGPLSTLVDLDHMAAVTVAAIADAYGCAPDDPLFLYHLAGKVAEEGAEALAAYGEVSGWARKPGTWEHFDEECADTVISAWLAMVANGRDMSAAIRTKHAKVMSRGFKLATAGAVPEPTEER